MLRFTPRSLICAIALPLLMSGCASLTTDGAPSVASTESQAARVYHDAIELGGRLSVRYQQNGKEEAVHGNFTWSQKPEKTNIVLLSPLGQTLALIEVAPKASKLTQAGQPPRVAADPDALAAEALGWPLPVSGLKTWLQGFAFGVDGKPVTAGPDGASVTTPDGWRIHYANWQSDESSQGQSRPKRIDLDRTTAQAGNVSLRIVIDNWQIR